MSLLLVGATLAACSDDNKGPHYPDTQTFRQVLRVEQWNDGTINAFADFQAISVQTNKLVSCELGKESSITANGVKLITRPACEKICRFAFDYARKNGRKKVTAVHKANIMKLTDGLFLRTFREVAAEYPEIAADDCIIDALCMKLVQKPEQFDVLVAPNLYGDIISDLCAGLVGGLGFAPSANIGDSTRIYEAVHGSAPDIAGQDKANPSAILMAFAMMLNDLGETDKAAKLNAAILAQVEEGKVVTADIGGTAGTKEFTQAVIARL